VGRRRRRVVHTTMEARQPAVEMRMRRLDHEDGRREHGLMRGMGWAGLLFIVAAEEVTMLLLLVTSWWKGCGLDDGRRVSSGDGVAAAAVGVGAADSFSADSDDCRRCDGEVSLMDLASCEEDTSPSSLFDVFMMIPIAQPPQAHYSDSALVT